MKKIYFVMAVAIAALPVAAQETYENAKIINQDLNGTARYVGMGGATDALGGEISSISSNPAGIGLFRHNKVEGTVGMVSQQDAASYPEGDKTKLSFDQIGFVYSSRSGENSFLNMGFNYHKSRNFNYILSADDNLNNASQNKNSYMKLYNGLLYNTHRDGTINFDADYVTCNQLDDIFAKNLFYAYDNQTAYYYDATSYDFDRAHEGYIGAYDLNLSGNINDRVYLGLTVGVEDVHYKHISDYTEQIATPNNIGLQRLNVYDERRITGSGYNIKFGAIFRPVEYVPFLIGASISTPTWYRLTTENYTEVTDFNNTSFSEDVYDYKVYTPWKFGLNLGYTDGKQLALGASIDYADYGTTDTRINDGGSYDFYDYYESSSSDKHMNRHTKQTLKGVCTLKVGGEFKVIPELALRAGYNYVSAMYDKDGFKDGTVNSPGSYYSSSTDFTNWKDTNRLTFGIGWRIEKNWNFDLAYQYSVTKGDFAPFPSYEDNNYSDWDNIVRFTGVENKRHQILCSVGYTF
ncbi:MAG: hemin receptor [Prevotella sp.]|nr:hemin receptor [Prevotella sp.]